MEDKRPNFLVIVADDLGFSDCGCFGSEISTPNIDALAKSAIQFTDYHVASACSPTRSMLMTGTDHHIAGLGQLQEITRNSPAHANAPGHEGYLNQRVIALPELLSEGGYSTFMSGKWHLGLKQEHWPISRGFQKSYALLPGCANHYAYEPEYKDPDSEPGKFFETATRALHVEDDKYLPRLPDSWYSSDAYADKMISYLEGRKDQEKERPFFAYLPFTAPHWPLQAPREVCDKYRGLYNDGPDALRSKRLQRLKELGIVEERVKPHPVIATDGRVETWEELSEEIRKASSRAMEVYAGMVDRMDWNIGRVIDHLKMTGEYDNTFILFMSDNGAEGASYEAQETVGDSIMAHIDKYYNNSLDNIGRGDSFVWYGPYWAQAATAPSRLFKMHSTEGGCRVPLVVKPPANDGMPVGAGVMTDAFCSVMGVVPTILEMAGLKHPGTRYKGREIAPVRGRSWVRFLSLLKEESSSKLDIHGTNYVMGFENAGSAALRKGDWKITFVGAPHGPQRWELFNIRQDPGEINDVCQDHPKLFEELKQLWQEYKDDVGVVGLAGEYALPDKTARKAILDEMEDPYAWIKYIGRPDITPEHLKTVVPTA